MAHYAHVVDGIVVDVIRLDNNLVDEMSQYFEGDLIKTSYNTSGGLHYEGYGVLSETQHKAIRKNFAGVGYSYDASRDAFIPPKPFETWTLDETTCLWKAPVDMPADAGTGDPPKFYRWDEATTNWVVVEVHPA